MDDTQVYERARTLVETARKSGDKHVEAKNLFALGKLYCSVPQYMDFTISLDCFRQAKHLFRLLGDAEGYYQSCFNIGFVIETFEGNLREALAEYQNGLIEGPNVIPGSAGERQKHAVAQAADRLAWRFSNE